MKNMVMLPKGEVSFRSIVLVEVIWKVFTSIINSQFHSVIALHDDLNRFRQGQGTGTDTLEENSAQKLVGIFH